jgi:hypothetical protein
MDYAAIAVTVRYAPLRGREGVAWGVEPEGGGLGGGRDECSGPLKDEFSGRKSNGGKGG